MLDKLGLENFLKQKSYGLIIDQDICSEYYTLCKSKYDLPRGVAADYISLRKEFSEANEFVLFILLDCYEQVKDFKVSKKTKYFTEKEINDFSKMKYIEDKIKFPIVFDMIQNAEDQWIGCISTKQLMLLRKAQLINYEENTQRTKRRVQRGENVYYEISLNQKAIKSIMDSMNNGQYIADDITLNIPLDSDADFIYDKERKQMIIKSLKAFDIIDGYHRYISICRVSDMNPDFDYNMELRITNFDETKGRNFIYQKDQKTKMSKLDSNSYNMNNAANIIVDRLNKNTQCNIMGLIGRNDGIINFAELSTVVGFYYVPRTINKTEERKLIIKVLKELTEDFNILTESNDKYLESLYSFKDIVAIVHVFKMFQDKENKSGMCELIEKLIPEMKLTDEAKYFGKIMKRTIEKEVAGLVSKLI